MLNFMLISNLMKKYKNCTQEKSQPIQFYDHE
jgi:hypothetical protein